MKSTDSVAQAPNLGQSPRLDDGTLASTFHAKATMATIRAQLMAVPARRELRLHLPEHWPWKTAWAQLFDATCRPPAMT